MKLFTKKRLPLFIGIATILGLAQCDWIRTDVSQMFFPPVELEFPMGEGKQVSYRINSWIDKPYAMGLVIEFVNWDKAVIKEQEDMPFSFSVACYRIGQDGEILLFQKDYNKSNDFYGRTGYELTQPYSLDSRAWTIGLGGFRLPYGSYRCDFKDTSKPEIKEYLQQAGVVRTFVNIFPYKPIIY